MLAVMFAAGTALGAVSAQPNLLQNPGFEQPPDNAAPPHWTTPAGAAAPLQLTGQAPHAGRQALAIPAHAAVEQNVASAKAGAYVFRAWVKSEAQQRIALLVHDPAQPWVGYTCAEINLPAREWTQVDTFCCLDKDGSLTVALGELPSDFRLYHGVSAQMPAPIVVDDVELFRYEPKSVSATSPTAWEAKSAPVDWSRRSQWSPVQASTNPLSGTGIIRSAHLVGIVRPGDGSLEISSIQGDRLKPRCTLVPSIPIPSARCSIVTEAARKGLRISSPTADCAYTAWFTPEGLISIAADHIPQFQVKDCRLRYGLLPSFAGTDICYAPAKMRGPGPFHIPSTQWLVGLVDGNDSMLVAVWQSAAQAVSLALAGDGANRLIDSLNISTATAGFSLSLVEHANIWRCQPLNEDWLGEYVPIDWQRPFPARWMCQFFVTPATKPTFRQPCMDYSFPIASANTRQWGVWFESWNHYPAFFDGPRTILHFEKTFVPNGDALIYFLQPAAADLYSPCEIVEQTLGREKAMALLDFDANRLRKLSYSTPDEFMFDRPVCATTTRLSKIKREDKATLGPSLATHLYEFIREIRGRVDQYSAFFARMQDYLSAQEKAHPELKDYLAPMQTMIADAQARSKDIYAVSLPSVQAKTDAMKKLLLEGKADGFDCGDLDVRNTAGAQDDLCRHYNRLVMRLMQTAALDCGDSPRKALIARHIWDESRGMLRQPTRWESRRTLYFFEP